MDFTLIIAIFASIIATFLAIKVISWLIRREAFKLNAQKANAKSQEAKADQTEDLMQMMGEVITEWTAYKESLNGEEPNFMTFGIKHLPIIVAKHPMTAFKYGKRLQKMIEKAIGSTTIIQGIE